MRLRLIGGRITANQLDALSTIAQRYGDSRVYVTSRANLQIRGLPGTEGRLDEAVAAAIAATGLVPSPTHELVRNVMVSPATGIVGGRTDLRPLATTLDRLLCATPDLADLAGRFLFVLDDGRGDLLDRRCDLGLVALNAEVAQLRIGDGWGPVLALGEVPAALIELARAFVQRRGTIPTAAWHVAELSEPLISPCSPNPRLPMPTPPLGYGSVIGGRHVAVPKSGLDAAAVSALTLNARKLIVTPWRGVLLSEVGS